MTYKSKKFIMTLIVMIACIYGMIDQRIDYLEGLLTLIGMVTAFGGLDIAQKHIEKEKKETL